MSGVNKILLFLNIVVLTLIVMVAMVYAWTNPTANPPSGGGALYYSGGYVGIGTVGPTKLLQFGNNADAEVIRIGRTDNTHTVGIGATGFDSNLLFFANGVEKMRMDINGNVTISGNLTVNGSASNTCTKVVYSYPATTSCPQYYYVTTIANPTQTGDMICCKVNNPS
jgi:opacity protein-like surface antigen